MTFRRPIATTYNEDNKVSQELNEASSQLLHLSLDIHSHQDNSFRGTDFESFNGRTRRSKSVGDLRIAADLYSAGSQDQKSSFSGLDLEEDHSTSGAHRPARLEGVSRSSTEPVQKTLASSKQLLKRVTSVDELLVLGAHGDDDEVDDEFSSDEEPFRIRPPSIASSTTSHRSSRVGVRLEDRSDRECDAFARDVRIRGFHSIGAQNAGGFVVFDIEIVTREGTIMRIHKRYSAFSRLRGHLIEAFPHLRPLIPRLPPKSTLSKFRTSFLERRRQQLGFWLNTVLLHPEIGSSVYVRQWVLES